MLYIFLYMVIACCSCLQRVLYLVVACYSLLHSTLSDEKVVFCPPSKMESSGINKFEQTTPGQPKISDAKQPKPHKSKQHQGNISKHKKRIEEEKKGPLKTIKPI